MPSSLHNTLRRPGARGEPHAASTVSPITGVRADTTIRSVAVKTAGGGERQLACEQILVAAGRRPVTAGLNLPVRAGARGDVIVQAERSASVG